MGKQPCCDNVGHNRGPWTVEEDHKLTNFILNNGIQNWRHVPKLAGLVRCGKSCRLRWMNHLRPDLKKGAFTEDEEYMLIKLQSQLGNRYTNYLKCIDGSSKIRSLRWSKIAAHFPGRTDNEIKNHWNTRIKKKLYTEQTRDIKEGSTKQKYSGQQSLPSLEYLVKDQQQLKEPIEISEMGSNDVNQNSEPVETISIERNGNNMIKAVAAGERHNLDHLQRQSKHQSHQPRKRSVQMAPVGLWDRFPTARTVQQMMETMDRIMEDPSVFSSRGRTPWEIKESEGEYKMRFDMPGMTKEDVRVWVEEKMLVVKAEKKTDENISEKEEEWSARSYGKYNSRIALPENVEFENIKAEVRDGVLYLTIPKACSPKVFDINVQ